MENLKRLTLILAGVGLALGAVNYIEQLKNYKENRKYFTSMLITTGLFSLSVGLGIFDKKNK